MIKDDQLKYCSGCGRFLPRTEFYRRNNSENRPYLVSRCKSCRALYNKEHKEERAAMQRKLKHEYIEQARRLKNIERDNPQYFRDQGIILPPISRMARRAGILNRYKEFCSRLIHLSSMIACLFESEAIEDVQETLSVYVKERDELIEGLRQFVKENRYKN